ncbi:hypothetical protein [Paludisphaera sp.]|uniref:hypothetical protein n=1 Tax=Paludisphaera sp. TaxID=2017432 RepID=UPI00301CA8CC
MTLSYVTQSRLGSWFGISSIKVGKILVMNGLKDCHGATRMAVAGGYAKEAQTKEKLPFWVWDATRVSLILDEALGGVGTSFIDELVVQVGEALAEAHGLREGGNDFVAELIEDQALAGVPPGLVGLLRGRLSQETKQTIGA